MMKKIISCAVSFLIVFTLVACGGKEEETDQISFPFEEADINQIQVYYRNATPDNCERIVVSDEETMQKIYRDFSNLVLNIKENDHSDYVTDMDTVSIRFLVQDGNEFNISFVNQGDGGFISFTSGDGQYYTKNAVSSSWLSLNEIYESETVGLDEMP